MFAVPGEYIVKVNAYGRNSDVETAWTGVRKLTELEVETWFEETRRVRRRGRKKRRASNFLGFLLGLSPDFVFFFTIQVLCIYVVFRGKILGSPFFTLERPGLPVQ